MDYRTYEDIAQRIRVDVIKEVFGANSGHPGGSACFRADMRYRPLLL